MGENMMENVVESGVPTRNTWLEVSRGTTEHGGPGWELGVCLWSPTTKQWGGYRYMLDPLADDCVIHCFNGMLVGMSRVARPCYETGLQPPLAGRWAKMAPYFRIDLRDYRPFQNRMLLRDFVTANAEQVRNEITTDHPKRYPFCISGRGADAPQIHTVQGRLISRITPNLLRIFSRSLQIEISTFADR